MLGVDYGDARIGVALSDALRTVATPLETIDGSSLKKATRRLRELLEEHAVGEIVVGLPLLMNGDEGDRAALSRAFAQKMESQVPGLVVHLWDERLTSAEAERVLRLGEAGAKKRKQMRDQIAAQLILQSWMDANAAY